MNIEIITAYTSNIEELSNLSYDSIIKYCNIQNIQYSRQLLENISRAPSWYKIKLILSKFDEGVDYVMWIDADTIITNFDFNLYSLIDSQSKLYLTKDINGINCGVMIWKRDDQTYDILNKIWSMTEFDNHIWWEQAAIRSLYDQDYNNIQSIIKFIDQNKINSYDYSLYNMRYEPGQHNEQSFLIHFPGIDNEMRLQLIKQYTK